MMCVVVVHLTGDHGGVMPHYPLLLPIFTKEAQKIVTLASTPQGARVQAHNHVLPLQGEGGNTTNKGYSFSIGFYFLY